MCKVRTLRAFVKQRLSAAAEEIMELFERTLREYEDEIVQTTVFPVRKVPAEQPDQSPDPEEPPHVKEEQQELWTGRGGEQQADITEFTFTPVPVKSEEDDEEKAQSSQLLQSQTEENTDEHLKTEADGEDCGEPEPARNFNPGLLQPEAGDSNDNFYAVKVPVSDMGCYTGQKYVSCSDGARRFGSTDNLQIHMKCRTGVKTFNCPFCGKKFTKSSNLNTHLRVHTGEKPFTCSVCNTSFSLRCTLVNHMRVHTGEKPFICSVCAKGFSKKANVTTHMALHTKEKPFKCPICDKRFTWHSQVRNHKCVDGSR